MKFSKSYWKPSYPTLLAQTIYYRYQLDIYNNNCGNLKVVLHIHM